MSLSLVLLLSSTVLTFTLLNFESSEPYFNLSESYFEIRDITLFFGTKDFFIITVITVLLLTLFKNKKINIIILYSSLWLILVYYTKLLLARDTIARGGGFFQEINYGLLPSGHSAVYLFTSFILYTYLITVIKNKKILIIINTIIILGFILLSILLVLNNYHYISDITASLALFIFATIIYKVGINKIIYKR
jgi:membrane-associated phospholipid phosphatase